MTETWGCKPPESGQAPFQQDMDSAANISVRIAHSDMPPSAFASGEGSPIQSQEHSSRLFLNSAEVDTQSASADLTFLDSVLNAQPLNAFETASSIPTETSLSTSLLAPVIKFGTSISPPGDNTGFYRSGPEQHENSLEKVMENIRQRSNDRVRRRQEPAVARQQVFDDAGSVATTEQN